MTNQSARRELRIDRKDPVTGALVNRAKRALAAGQTIVGSEVTRIPDPEVVRIFAAAGYDFAFIDMEHSCFSLETVSALISAARTHGICPVVRVPQAEYSFVSRVLDCGAQGIIVPRVNTPEQVRQIVSWMRYPPLGVRGFACTPSQTQGYAVDPATFIDAMHRETLLVIQIERVEAIAQLDEMMAIDGVDVACLGYMDLSVDLGLPGEIDHPKVVSCVERLIDTAALHGVASGIIHPDLSVATRWMRRGMRFVSHAGDSILLELAAKNACASLREVEAAASPRPTNPAASTVRTA